MPAATQSPPPTEGRQGVPPPRKLASQRTGYAGLNLTGVLA